MQLVKKLLKMSAVLAVGVGLILVGGGGWALMFTYQNVAQEKIVTPEDASIPNAPVRGPLTLKSQAEVIYEHTLKAMDGKTYAEVARGEDRSMWITATALMTALNLGVITYLFAGLIILFGLISIWTGVIWAALSRKY
jgi:hypothetical protein